MGQLQQSWGLGSLVLLSAIALMTDCANAQVIPDQTLGTENSTVRNEQIPGRDGIERSSDLIEGGARRGGNLFHSFGQFDVPEGQGAYFANPEGVANILGRVTGDDRSEIFGTLGVLGSANLFLINPNGIMFGSNASLDIQGSFAATTANGVQLGDQGFFSATSPNVPSSLLVVSPSAFLFNQISTGNITNRSTAPIFPGSSILGLQVGDRQTLLLLASNVENDGGRLNAFEGRVEIGAVAGIGTVGLNSNGSLNFPSTLARGDVSFNESQVDVTFNKGGDIGVIARNIDVSSNSLLRAGIDVNSGATGNQAGNLTLDATGDVRVRQDSRIENTVRSGASGNGGDISITALNISLTEGSSLVAGLRSGTPSSQAGSITLNAANSATFVDSSVLNYIFSEGKAGNISINTGELRLLDGTISSSTLGEGNAGNVVIKAGEIQISNGALGSATYGRGDSGDTNITTRRLTINSSGYVAASAFDGSSGRGGNLTITASEQIEASGTEIISGERFVSGITAETTGTGDAGTLRISTGRLLLRDGASIKTETSNSGRGGDLIIHASESIEVVGGAGRGFASTISSETDGGTGNAGNLTIYTPRLFVQDGAVISSSIRNGSRGAGGNLTIEADKIDVFGTRSNTPNLVSAIVSSALSSNEQATGNIVINTRQLSVRDGGRVSTVTSGSGEAGSLQISASEFVEAVGMSPDEQFSSGLSTGVIPSDLSATGQGGNLSIVTSRLSVREGGTIFTSTFSQGNAGELSISANESLDITGSSENTSLASNLNTATSDSGAAGNLRLNTRHLSITDGAQIFTGTSGKGQGSNLFVEADFIRLSSGSISSSTFGQNDAGNITIQNANIVSLDRNSSISTSVNQGATGQGGEVDLQTGTLQLNDSRISGETSGTGNAGNITVRDANTVSLDRSTISSTVNLDAIGNGGNINLQTDRLFLTNGAEITASTSGRGNAGNITILDANAVDLDRSTVSSTVNDGAIGRGGNITLQTDRLNLDRANITARTQGQGRAGNITVQDTNRVNLNRNSIISTEVGTTGIGRGGNIKIEAAQLQLNNSDITSSTSGQGNTGTINLNTTSNINLRNRSRITNRVEERATGNARTIRLNTPELSLQGNSLISAATDGSGRSGNVIVPNANSVSLNNSRITTRIKDDGVVPQSANSRNNRRSNIILNTDTLTLANNARVTASTQGQGNAGNITVRNAENVTIEDGSTISTAVQEGAVGRGGNINLTSDTLNLEDARITARTEDSGRAGNIAINASDSIAANNSTIETRSNNSSSGNVAIEAGTVQLQGNSDIRTQVNRGEGRGGNIALTANSVVAFDDSDIVTSAPEGQGGNITFNTPAFFGDGYQPDTPETESSNDRVDVDASGVQSGIVTTPDVSFIQNSLADLSDNATDPETLLANSCIVRDRQQGRFTVTGSGGSPERPGNASQSAYPTGTIQSVSESESRGDRPWQMGDAIVEPQGVYRLSNGRLVMGRECSTTTGS